MNNLIKLKKYLSIKEKVLIIILLFTILVGSFLDVWPITLMKKIVDLAQLGNTSSISTILMLGIGYIIFQVANAFFKAYSKYLAALIQTNIGAQLQNSLYNKLLKTEMIFLQKSDSVSISNLLIEDTNFVSNNLVSLFRKLFYAILTFIIGFYFLFSMIGKITFYILPLGFITSLSMKYISKKSETNLKDLRNRTAKIWKSISEGIRGIFVIRIYNHENKYKEKVEQDIHNLKSSLLKQKKLESISFFSDSSLFVISIGLIMLISAISVVKGIFSLGTLTAIMMYNSMLVDPLMDLLEVQQDFIKMSVSLKRIEEFFMLPDDAYLEKEHMNISQVKVNNVTFKFEKDSNVIENFNMDLCAPCNIAIVGKTGSGKTTLANIISGIYKPQKGKVEYFENGKNVNGKPIISYCLQDGYLFDQSIENNIKIANPNISKERYQELLKICCLEDVVETHQNSAVGENGSNLSGGEKKRVRIMQALANTNADIYIFDELTSSLDEKTGKQIVENILNMKLGKICIFIEHNSNISKIMDRMIHIPIDN